MDLSPEKLIPPYWINMGATAISTLDGADLMLHAPPGSLLENVLHALKWSTLCWAVTTWWIPSIVILNVWRYSYKRFPIAYDVQHWSMVFPPRDVCSMFISVRECFEADSPYTNLTIFRISPSGSMDYNVHGDGERIYSKIVLTIRIANTGKTLNAPFCFNYERIVGAQYLLCELSIIAFVE
ncbi:MAG TPA: hypothetical protein VL087_01800 [Nitrospirota bacterium]|nr:hypothetical protein [Nitrospirota bacterium]